MSAALKPSHGIRREQISLASKFFATNLNSRWTLETNIRRSETNRPKTALRERIPSKGSDAEFELRKPSLANSIGSKIASGRPVSTGRGALCKTVVTRETSRSTLRPREGPLVKPSEENEVVSRKISSKLRASIKQLNPSATKTNPVPRIAQP